jgi:hypothetical protein
MVRQCGQIRNHEKQDQNICCGKEDSVVALIEPLSEQTNHPCLKGIRNRNAVLNGKTEEKQNGDEKGLIHGRD